MSARETEGEIAAYFDRLWPLNRSLTGEGVRATHDILGELLPLKRIEIPSGTQVFDWTIPPEWRVKAAYVTGPDGKRLFDVKDNNLHLVGYSIPFRGKLARAELDKHLHSLPDLPDALPYVTSYYRREWGFCLPHKVRQSLPDGQYDVVVDTELDDNGSMTLSETVLPGASDAEILISTYTCHPSLANNELSGPLAASFLYRRLASWPQRRHSFRFVFLPETIGSIAYLHRCGEHLKAKLAAGYVVTCVGLDDDFTYKRSKRGDTLADRAAEIVLRDIAATGGPANRMLGFFPSGSDERQYCSPAFNLPVGSLMRGMYATRPQYHTSLDNREHISFASLQQTIDAYEAICRAIDNNAVYRSTVTQGEPFLSKYDLYPPKNDPREVRPDVMDILWLLSLADGRTDLLSIAARSKVPVARLIEAALRCRRVGLVEECAP